MAKARSACSIIWRTVVCAALAPACHHPAPKPAPEPAATLPDCDELEPLPEVYPEVADPPPGDPADGRITIGVTSTPSGADVTVDDEETPRGKTPLEVVFEVEDGSRTITVSLAGHESGSSRFYLDEDRDRAFEVVLLDSAMLAARPRCIDNDRHPDFGFIVS
jgi:hypothetical protein